MKRLSVMLVREIGKDGLCCNCFFISRESAEEEDGGMGIKAELNGKENNEIVYSLCSH